MIHICSSIYAKQYTRDTGITDTGSPFIIRLFTITGLMVSRYSTSINVGRRGRCIKRKRMISESIEREIIIQIIIVCTLNFIKCIEGINN